MTIIFLNVNLQNIIIKDDVLQRFNNQNHLNIQITILRSLSSIELE